MAKKNHIANGIAAKIPEIPFGIGFICRLLYSNSGKATPAKINNSKTAKIVITNSKVAAILTPKIFIRVKIK